MAHTVPLAAVTTPLIGAIGFEPLRIDHNRWFVLGAEKAAIVDRLQLDVLRACGPARTLEEHARQLVATGVLTHSTEAMAVLQRLSEEGLIALKADPWALDAARTRRDSFDIKTVAVVTADRPEHLDRCLNSIVSHLGSTAERLSLLVVDGSQLLANRQLNRLAVRRRADGLRAVYVGPEEAAWLREVLVEPTNRRPTLERALAPGGIGANRNLCCLVTAGQSIVMIDDDVVLSPWGWSVEPKIQFSWHEESRRIVFCRSRTEALQSVTWRSVNVFSAHNVLLGQRMRDLAAEGAETREMCRHLAGLPPGEADGARVRMTCAGVVGDSGITYPEQFLLKLEGLSAEAMKLSADVFRTALSHREVARASEAYAVIHEPNCQAYCMGLWNQEPLVPFLPTGRNEDGLFATMTFACDPASLIGHIPVGVVHDSSRSAEYEAIGRFACESRLSDFLRMSVFEWSRTCPAESVAGRRHYIVSRLRHLASLPEEDLGRLHRRFTVEMRCRELAVANRTAAATPSIPSYWRSGLVTYQEEFGRAVNSGRFLSPSDLPPGASFGSSLGAFADLVEAWPELWHRAKQHRLADVLSERLRSTSGRDTGVR